MPTFCNCCNPGNDEYICQKCARICCSAKQPSTWMLVPGKQISGNVCPACVNVKPDGYPMDSLYEHCRKESGLSDPQKINAYMQRHYGHS